MRINLLLHEVVFHKNSLTENRLARIGKNFSRVEPVEARRPKIAIMDLSNNEVIDGFFILCGV